MIRSIFVIALLIAGTAVAQPAGVATEDTAPTSAESPAAPEPAAAIPAQETIVPVEMLLMSSQTPSPVPVEAPADMPADVARGQYLVHHVTMCVQCHSPRQPNGKLITDQLLMGAPVPVDEPSYVKDWAYQAPAIAGLPGYSKEDMVRLLVQGITRDGTYPAAPMRPFRMKQEDAEAIAVYLDSLRRGR
ncbi:MAG: hypothetical protein AAGD38_21435 [Acidobacteriota bacterium]